MRYVLTPTGEGKIKAYISEMNAKRKEILDAGIDEADDVSILSVDEIFEDLCADGMDADGDMWNTYAVTNQYDADSAILLSVDIDFLVDI